MTKKDFQILLGKRIKQLRNEKNITQVELAYLIEIERSNMSRIESGNTNPSSYLLFVIAEKLQIETFELLNFKSISE